MENFDVRKIMDEQVKPLSDQIFAICKANEIPVVLIGASKAECTETRNQTTFFEMAFLPGEHRTPTLLALIAALIEQDYSAAMMFLLVLATCGQGKADSELDSTPAPAGSLLN